MKKGFFVLLAGLCVVFSSAVLLAVPIDISGFTTNAPDGIEVVYDVDGNGYDSISFTELADINAVYFDAAEDEEGSIYPNFFVNNSATLLTFYFTLQLDNGSAPDFLRFEAYSFNSNDAIDINTYNNPYEVDSLGRSYYQIDFTHFREQTIYLAWSLSSSFATGGDGIDWGLVGSEATVYNIDLATQESPAPVPEPATLILFGTGLLGAAGLRKGRDTRSKKKIQ